MLGASRRPYDRSYSTVPPDAALDGRPRPPVKRRWRIWLAGCWLPLLMAAALASLPARAQAQSNLLVNGDFEDSVVPQGFENFGVFGTTSLPGWSVTSGNVDVVVSAFWQSYSGDKSLDLVGTINGTIEQTFASRPGQQYLLTGAFTHHPESPVGCLADINVDSSFVGRLIPTSGVITKQQMGWQTFSYPFTATGTQATLQIADKTITSFPGGIVLDYLAVTVVNSPPVARSNSLRINEDQSHFEPAPGLLENDTDVDGDLLTTSLIPGQGPSHGQVTVNPNGSYTYTPAANYNGTDSFRYQVSDGQGGTSSATVDILIDPVNDDPIARANHLRINEDEVHFEPAPGLLENDEDPDGDTPLTTSLINGQGPSHGHVTVNADGSYTYTPDPNYNGTDSFRYLLSDGHGGTSSATVDIRIDPVNDDPVARANHLRINEDQSHFEPAPGLLENDTDVDGDALTTSLMPGGGPAHGQVTVNPDGSYTYTPDANYNGTDSFTYQVSDGHGGTASALVDILIDPQPDRPVADPQTLSTDEDTPLAITLTGSDADGDSLTFAVTQQPEHGTLSGTPPNVSYQPAPDYHGDDSFKFTVSDGSLTSDPAVVSITVTPVNDRPVARNDSASVDEDGHVAIPVLANDTDVDGDPLTVASVTEPGHGTAVVNADGTVEYRPAADYNGSDSFNYTISDGNGGSATAEVSVTVTPVNDRPVADARAISTDEDTAVAVTLTGSDRDGDSLTFTVTRRPAHGTLSGTPPNVTYTPEADYNGADSFAFTASDGSLTSDPAEVSITVNPVNDAPVAAGESYTTAEDTPLVVAAPGVLGNDTDIDSVTLTAMPVSGPAHGTLALNSDGSFTYTPGADYNGSDQFKYQASDGTAASAIVTVSLTIEPRNDKPQANAGADQVREATGPTTTATLNGGGSTDVDGDTLSYSWSEGGAALGTGVSLAVDLPVGTHTILLTVDDGNGGTDTDTVVVTIQDTTPPTLSGVPATINATATQATGAFVTYAAPAATDLVGPVTINCSPASGSLFPPGTTTVTCTATDAAGNTTTATFLVKVTFAWSGFLHPKPDGSSVFKLGKVVKVSFQLTGASAGITDAVATFSFRKVDSTPGSVNEPDFLEPPTAGNLFEYQGGEYVYKWGSDAGTSGPGTYEVRVDLHDGVLRTVTLDLR